MHNNQKIKTRYQKDHKTYQLKEFLKMGGREDFCVFDYLLKHTETRDDYLYKYRTVVESILQGMSLRKVSETSEFSYATVGKVSTILKYGNSNLQPNPYLIKHSDIVKELLKGSTQREVAEKTGASLATVNTVAKITELDYIQINRKKGKVRKEKWKQKTKNDPRILDFIKANYSIWAKNVQGNFNDEDVIREYNEYLKTITIPSIFDLDRYKKINDTFTNDLIFKIEEDRRRERQKELGRERVRQKINENEEYHRLQKIEEDKQKKEFEVWQAKNQLEYEIRELEKIEETKKHKIEMANYDRDKFYKLLDAGINPWSTEWDIIPNEYLNLEHRMTPISFSWYEDQVLISDMRVSQIQFKEHAKDNVKEFDLDLAGELLSHYAFILRKQWTESYDYIEEAEPSVQKAIIKDKTSENNDFRTITERLYNP